MDADCRISMYLFTDTDFMHLLYMKLCGTYGQDILCLVNTSFNFTLGVEYFHNA